MDVPDGACIFQMLADEADFLSERNCVGLEGSFLTRCLRVAAAIVTKLTAIRHVQVKRQRIIRCDSAQPVRIGLGCHASVEVWRSRITRVARYVAQGVGKRIFCHGRIFSAFVRGSLDIAQVRSNEIGERL